jgi:hypothetical protein
MTLNLNHAFGDVERVRRRTRASPDAPLRHLSIPGHAFQSGFAVLISQLLAGGS